MTPAGLPLGVLKARFEAPVPKAERSGDAVPEERKSARWIEGLRDCADLARELGPGRLVCVMDREADDFRLFEEQRARPEVDVLVRVKGRRRVAGREHRGKPPMRLQGVLVEEERTPEGAAPIRWLLLTTLAADTPEACRRIVGYYARRWRIEDWHRILKSGCTVEELANRSADRLARAAAVNLVVAWRIFLMTLLGRDQPDLPCDVLFSELETRVLKAFAAQHGIRPPDTLAAAVLVVARIGGHIHRPRGPPPGTKVVWRGTTTLAGMCIGYRLAMEPRQ